MNALLWIGSGLGAVCGLCHAVYLWRNAAERTPRKAAVLYRGVWTVGLWTVFGTYVLVLWALGASIWFITRAMGDQRRS